MSFDMSAQIAEWGKQLLDTTKRNPLISFKTGKTGGIRLVHPTADLFWQRLVIDGKPLTIAWKHEILGLSSGEEGGEIGPDPIAPNQETSERERANREGTQLQRCLDSPRLRLDLALADMQDKSLRTRLNRLSLNSREAQTERGVSTLYAAFGILQWYEGDNSSEAIRSPLILVPVSIGRTEGIDSPWRLTPEDDDIRFNAPLAQRLLDDFKLRFDLEPDDPSALDAPTFRTEYYRQIASAVRNQSRWLVLDEVALGTFSFQKLAMYEDLRKNAELIKSHLLCRVIAGDPAAALRSSSGLPSERELDDRLSPEATFQILDADSSQQAAILAATRGADLVMDGPPGTGKSQTIANIIAEAMAAGKSILFVAEKTAALEVVKRRLDGRGLGDFCLELHSHKANKKIVLAELERCLARSPESAPDSLQELVQLGALRGNLNSYVRELHKRRDPLGKSVFQVHAELASLSRVSAGSRHSDPRILERDRQYLENVSALFPRLATCASVLQAYESHPWRNCKCSTYTDVLREDAQFHCGRLAKLCPRLAETAAGLARVELCSEMPTYDELQIALSNAWVAQSSDAWSDSESRQELLEQLERWGQCAKEAKRQREQLGSAFHSRSFKPENAQFVSDATSFRAWWSRLRPRWWRMRKTIRELWRNSVRSTAQFWDELGQLKQFHDHWQAADSIQKSLSEVCLLDSDGKRSPKRTRDYLKLLQSQTQHLREGLANTIQSAENSWGREWNESWAFLTSRLFETRQEILPGFIPAQSKLSDLEKWLTKLAAEVDRLAEWLHLQEIIAEAERLEMKGVIDELLHGSFELDVAAAVFRLRFFRLWQDSVLHHVPYLRQFRTVDHEQRIEMFRQLDKRSIESSAKRIRGMLLERKPNAFGAAIDAPESSELGTLLREIHKKRRHLPLRKLFAKIPTILPRLKPCLMMSPLSVSTYLDSPDLKFDVVIFDEASQVRPPDAMGAVYRSNQLVVAGDQRQLPPTSFFERMLTSDDEMPEDSDEEIGLADYESILDVWCSRGAPRRRLRWHYRSRREGLIAFANQFVYDDELVTFPSPEDVEGNPPVEFKFVSEGRWEVRAGVNTVEARQVAELIVEHFRRTPELSLGVVAFSQRQQLRILDELETLRRANPDLEDHFRDGREEPFFVKNLENVQGDERDVIVLGVGYGPDSNGKIAMRFGPLNQQGGERRLNVAITRARQHMVVVSSMRATDIDLSRTGAKGVQLLRSYLDYAENGKKALPAAIGGANQEDFDSPFERDVAQELERRGLTVHRQVGCSGYRIDLAIVDPKSPGRYLLAVECDGATYHSAATARDRDRLRQEVLEGLGWRFCRIWSTDWLRDREAQIRRVLQALERAKTRSQPISTTPSLAPPVEAALQTAVESYISQNVPRQPDWQTDYEWIDDVPENEVRKHITDSLRTFGATDIDGLVKEVRQRLGFKRTGSQIKERVETIVRKLQRSGEVVSMAGDDRVRLAPEPGTSA